MMFGIFVYYYIILGLMIDIAVFYEIKKNPTKSPIAVYFFITLFWPVILIIAAICYIHEFLIKERNVKNNS